ncbi:MAG: hypothetical protein KGN02_03190 [bacterium]|nr:hypothetical protein [bacterium]
MAHRFDAHPGVTAAWMLDERLRTAAIFSALVLAAVLGLAFARYVPVDSFVSHDWQRPIAVAPRVAYAFARAQLAALGGLPGDAVLDPSFSVAQVSGGGLAAPMRSSYTFTWYPRDALGTRDQIRVEVAQRADGGLYLASVRRQWRPAWLRTFEQWRIRAGALAVARPDRVTSTCPHGYDLAALLRIVGSSPAYAPYLSIRPQPIYPPNTPVVTASWRTPVAIPSRNACCDAHPPSPIFVTGAMLADDTRPHRWGPRALGLLVVAPRLSGSRLMWSRFISTDVERVCR